MTVEDLEIGQIYEVVEEFYSGYNASDEPELESILTSGVLKVGALMRYAKYDENRSTISDYFYGFHFIIDGKIVKHHSNNDGLFWFSEKELS